MGKNGLDDSASLSTLNQSQKLRRLAKLPFRYYLAGCGFIVLGLFISSVFPQSSKVIGDSPNITQQLIEEIRLLRQTLEHSQATVPAFQVILERIRFQKDIVNQVSQRASDARLSYERTRIEAEQFAQRIEDLKKQLQSSDAESRSNYENQIKEFQLQEIQQKKLEEFYRQEQDRLMPQLAEEQSKLDELNVQINKLQAELSATSRQTNK